MRTKSDTSDRCIWIEHSMKKEKGKRKKEKENSATALFGKQPPRRRVTLAYATAARCRRNLTTQEAAAVGKGGWSYVWQRNDWGDTNH